ncbi:MAG: class I SAM-dependent methyltransferase [Methylobacterium sp.]|nr:class I SAM-dependent methyltransferase [Methylobacterium sp.]
MADRALYDDPLISVAYSELRSRPGGPNEVIEQPALRSLMPSLQGRDVVDLGCGSGGLARLALEQGARSVRAFDASEQMIREAIKLGGDSRSRYEIGRIEDVVLPDRSADVVISGLALHYIPDVMTLSRRVSGWLREGGSFIFSVEHPIMTCASRQWAEATDGTRQHWPVDRYLEEGTRLVRWLGVDTPREHRAVASYINALIDAGLVIRRVLEPGPDPVSLQQWPKLADHIRRPAFLIIRADRQSA